MSNKKIKTSHNKQRNQYVYIGDYKSNNNDDNENLTLRYRIDLLSKRLKIIEDSLSSSMIIKAKPIMSVVMGDKNSMNKFNTIYENWINYISNIANSSSEIYYNVNNLFWQLDNYIFHQYFHNLRNNGKYIFEIVNVNFEKNNYTNEQMNIIKKVLSKDRNGQYKLLYSHHKEYISTLIMDNRVFIIYFENELYKICNTNINADTTITTNKNDLQFSDGKLHPALSLNNNVTGNIDVDIIKLNKGDSTINDTLDFPDVRDKRQIIIKNTKPLYNTLVDLVVLNKLNSSLYKFNPILLHLSLIIFHAMLHIKRDITNNIIDKYYDPSCPHDNHFIKEYLNYTPSALYGHPMIPPLTLSSH